MQTCSSSYQISILIQTRSVNSNPFDNIVKYDFFLRYRSRPSCWLICRFDSSAFDVPRCVRACIKSSKAPLIELSQRWFYFLFHFPKPWTYFVVASCFLHRKLIIGDLSCRQRDSSFSLALVGLLIMVVDWFCGFPGQLFLLVWESGVAIRHHNRNCFFF